MGEHGRFPPLFVALVAAGERAGGVERALAVLARHAAVRAAARRQLLHLLVYPLLVGLAAVGLFAYLGVTVWAEGVRLGERVARERTQRRLAPPPAPTRALESALLGSAVLALGATGLAIARGRTPAFAYAVPVVGKALVASDAALFTRSLAQLVAAGEPTERAVRLAGGAVGWPRLGAAAAEIARQLEAGSRFDQAVALARALPLGVRGPLAASAHDGASFTLALERCAEQAEADATEAARSAGTALEALFVLLAGAAVMACGIATYDAMTRLVVHLGQLE